MRVERSRRRRRAHHEHRDVLRHCVLLEPVAQAEAVHSLQLGREQDHVEPVRHRAREPRVSVGDDRDLTAERSERALQVEGEGTIVLEQRSRSYGAHRAAVKKVILSNVARFRRLTWKMTSGVRMLRAVGTSVVRGARLVDKRVVVLGEDRVHDRGTDALVRPGDEDSPHVLSSTVRAERQGRTIEPMIRRVALVCGLVACTSTGTPSPPPPTAHSKQAIDDLFRGYETKLPPPEGLGEQNGPFVECHGDRGTTITHLRGIGTRVPIDGDSDVAALVRWARHRDRCVLQIAIYALIGKVGYPTDSLWAELDDEHFQVHDVLISVKGYLDGRRYNCDPNIFDGLHLAPTEGDFARVVNGTWNQEKTPSDSGRTTLIITNDEVRESYKRAPPDGTQHDVIRAKIDAVSLGDRRQYVVPVSGQVLQTAQGPKPIVYELWPVKDGVMWYRNNFTGSWTKMRKGP